MFLVGRKLVPVSVASPGVSISVQARTKTRFTDPNSAVGDGAPVRKIAVDP